MNKRDYTSEEMDTLSQRPGEALEALLCEKENGSGEGDFVAMDKPKRPRVKWETVMGVKYEGTAVELDNGTLLLFRLAENYFRSALIGLLCLYVNRKNSKGLNGSG